MPGVDVCLDDLDPACVQPADERLGGLGGVSLPLPLQAATQAISARRPSPLIVAWT